MNQADWIIGLSPGAGQNGDKVIFEEQPKNLINHESSITEKYLKQYILSKM